MRLLCLHLCRDPVTIRLRENYVNAHQALWIALEVGDGHGVTKQSKSKKARRIVSRPAPSQAMFTRESQNAGAVTKKGTAPICEIGAE
jgi:hypothetical protein